MSWNKIANSYHGRAAITGMIPNQIFINKIYAMAMRNIQLNAFPTVLYDKQKLPKWSNKIGQALGVNGNPNDAVASAYRAPDMSGQIFDLVDRLITNTRENMGASDAALGNVRPDNTSAIIAVQKASSAPLELQRLNYYQFIEDYIRIMIDIMRAKYGVQRRVIGIPDEMGVDQDTEIMFDFSTLDMDKLQLKIDVGAASYWSELGQLTTMDNLFDRGMVRPETYVKGMPGNYIRNKNKILEELRQATEVQRSNPTDGNLDPTSLQNAERYIGGLEDAMSAV